MPASLVDLMAVSLPGRVTAKTALGMMARCIEEDSEPLVASDRYAYAMLLLFTVLRKERSNAGMTSSQLARDRKCHLIHDFFLSAWLAITLHSLLKFKILLAADHLKYQNNDAYVFDEIKAAHCLEHTVIH
jgi:hypothetical protein